MQELVKRSVKNHWFLHIFHLYGFEQFEENIAFSLELWWSSKKPERKAKVVELIDLKAPTGRKNLFIGNFRGRKQKKRIGPQSVLAKIRSVVLYGMEATSALWP